jgi:glycosyltransferase involved in cell wall biosynthesis
MKLLFVDSRYPLAGCGVMNGSRQRSILLSRALASMAEVDLLVIRPRQAEVECHDESPVEHNPFGSVTAMEYEATPRLWTDGLPKPLAQRLRLLLWNPHKFRFRTDASISASVKDAVSRGGYDAIVVRYLHNAVVSGALEAKAPVILDVDDLDYEHARNEIQMPYNSRASRFLMARHLPWLRRAAEGFYRRCDGQFVCKAADRAFPGLAQASVLPNIPFHLHQGHSPPLAEGDGKTVMFVGDLEWGPSTAAATTLVGLWPDVLRRIPNARLRLVGRCEGAPEAPAWRSAPGVELTGYVESIKAEYERSSIFAAPIEHGSGTSIKVLEAASYGRTGVVTPHAIRGSEDVLRNGREVLVASSREQLVEAICELLTDDDRRRRMAARAWNATREHFSFEAFTRIVCEEVRRVQQSGQ